MARPPGPRYPAALQTFHYLARPVAFLRDCQARYGDIFAIETWAFGPEVCVVRPETIKKIFTGDPDALRAGEANIALAPVLGRRSVLLLDGAEHLQQRRLMMPPFHGERMRAYARTMREVTERLVNRWPVGRPFALHPEMQRLTLEVILRTIFGVEDPTRKAALGDAITTLLDKTSSPLSILPQLRRELWGLSPWAAFKHARRRVDDLLYAEIARRRGGAHAGPRPDDVLSMLLDAKDDEGQSMTDEELRDELMTLLTAGHETTATSLCWALDAILHAPRVLERLQGELGARSDPDFDKLPYLDAAIKEVLRLRPVIPAVGRRVKEPMVLDGYDIPKGTLLVPAAWLTHRQPDLYPEPEVFRPERFLDNKPDPYAWFPFGGGTRRCLGMAFALFEMKVVLATVLARVRLRAANEAPAGVALRAFMIAPRGGVPVVVERRLPARAPDARPADTATVG